MKGYYAQVTAVLKQHGFYILRNGKGSHEVWGNGSCIPFTVSVTCNSRFTANKIMKDAGLGHRF